MTGDGGGALGAPFVHAADAPWEQVGAGVRRQLLGAGPDLMMARVDFEAGAVGAVHHHPHRQVTYVARGAFAVEVGGERRELEAGDSFFAAAGVPHGVTALVRGTLVDVFTPARADLLPPAPDGPTVPAGAEARR